MGASTIVYCAIYPPAVEDAGKFFKDCNVTPAKASTEDIALQDKLWEMSEELTELTFTASEEFAANSTPPDEAAVALSGNDDV